MSRPTADHGLRGRLRVGPVADADAELYREYVEADERKAERCLEPEERPNVDIPHPDVDVRSLGAEALRVKLWRFAPGEEVEYHAHEEQEDLFFGLSRSPR